MIASTSMLSSGYLLEEVGGDPVLFSDVLPGIDLAVFRPPVPNQEVGAKELGLAARQIIESVVEGDDGPGAWTKETNGTLLIAWRSKFRSAILAELGVRTLIGEPHEGGRRHTQGISQFADIDQGNIALPPLDATEVTASQSTLQGELLLRPPHRPPYLGQMPTE